MGLGLKIPCLLRVVIPVGEEEGGGLIGLREAGPIGNGEKGGGVWTGLLEEGAVEGGKGGENGIGAGL